jgi:phosphoenolpyruvate synthase/pyruvate phosphate dikinase
MQKNNNKNIALAFENLFLKDVEIAGGKGASLGEMTRAGIPVPPGFVILSTTFNEFIKEADLVQEIDAIIDGVSHKEMHTVDGASEKIQGLIKNAKMSERIVSEIKAQFRLLNTEFVAVRSSATAEDGKENAWAGQLDSFLNTKEEDLLEKIQHCWASLFTPRAIFYRFEKGLHNTKISVAVVVQKMINSEISGIAFSVHPVTEDNNQMIIEAGFGLGEAIVSGSITPDSYVVEKEPRRIIDINISKQDRGLYRILTGGSQWIDILEPKASSQVLTEALILKFSDLIMKIENHYGFPCDIEWAFESGKFYIVQSRPITTLRYNASKSKDALIEELIILRTRDRTLAPVYWNIVSQTSKLTEKIYNKKIGIEYNLFWGGKMKLAIPKNDWCQSGGFIAENLINRKRYFEDIEKKAKKAKLEILSFLKEYEEIDLDQLSFQDILSRLRKICSLCMKYDSASLLAWFVAGDLLKQRIGDQLRLSIDDLDIVAMPEVQTFVTQMEREVLEVSLKNEIKKESVKLLVDKYWWVPFDYDGPNIWDDKYFTHRIKEYQKNINEAKIKYDEIVKRDADLKQRSIEIIKKRKFTKKEKRLIHILRSNAVWTDERKMLDFQLFFQYNRTLSELGNRYDMTLTHLKYLFTHELSGLERNSSKLKKIAEQRMTEEFMTISKNGNIRIATEIELKKIKESIDQQPLDSDIKGNVACRGKEKKYTAHVKVLSSSKECHKIKRGEILIATMTTPDYAPAMDRALGFVTDEGGATCHAAIIAREMNKFCIVATKNATKLLKDGDFVEVNTNSGIVRILKALD